MNSNKISPRSAVFLHIQKTAGSSIVDLARAAYGSDQVTSHGDFLLPPKELDALVDARGSDDPKLQNRSFISGHFGYDYAKKIMVRRYSFTFLRNPIERVLSYYYFCRTRNPLEYEIYALTQNLSLDEFLKLGFERPSVKACIWNNQTWQLANGYGHTNGRNILSYGDKEMLDLAIGHLNNFSYIGFAETFEKDRDCILRSLNINPPQGKVVSNANPGRPTLEDLPRTTRDLLVELTHLDRALYKAAWRQRKTLIGRLSRGLKNLTRCPV
ncbi:MAG: sulfotransferase family 2 domain-containing protein [Diaphorobacter nitroreducens]|uniref:Sulfotransferase family protein n=1 Tax=Diaphorobacter nitroreducens TaxID=164759 RepID=A0AAX1WYT6_9BURK|nr:sulfotransferase family 2 domain-containing protein [Diaphorobacter sp. C33]ROR50656.1 sulfotransferase family protein [Diaphorobacter nitroreducens]WKK89580.1 sulfotransferase family 2 domain-containing protein [Diaphorobacter sp. C33]